MTGSVIARSTQISVMVQFVGQSCGNGTGTGSEWVHAIRSSRGVSLDRWHGSSRMDWEERTSGVGTTVTWPQPFWLFLKEPLYAVKPRELLHFRQRITAC
jgi:hypothetical protein